MAFQRIPSKHLGTLVGIIGALAALSIAACSSADDTPTRGDGAGTGGDSSTGEATGGASTTTGGQSSAGASGGSSATGGASCIAPATPTAASMNPGQGCTSCHSGSNPGGGVLITLGGTVYSAVSGGNAVSGATVVITDNNNNNVTQLVTGSDGNFYTSSTIAYPAKVSVSKCPDTVPMQSTVTNGNCNSCHGSSMQIHIP